MLNLQKMKLKLKKKATSKINRFSDKQIFMIYKDLKNYGKQLKKIPIEDWKTIAWFNRIIKNYLKMIQLEKQNKNSA